jgi:fatty acid desaturase
MTAVAAPQRDDYAQLRSMIRERGLLRKQPAYYVLVIARTAAALVAGILILLLVPNIWVRMGDAVLFALVFTQIGFLAHEAGHRQVFDDARKNDILGRICFNLLLGGSFAAWRDKHNEHHANPNIEDHDPDINLKAIAFSPEQAQEKRGLYRLTVRYQAFLLVPLLCFEAPSLRMVTYRYLVTRRPSGTWIEAVLIVVHYVLYFGLLFTVLDLPGVIAFTAINYALFGIHLGAVFAPNHKGMPILEREDSLGFLRRQVLTSRNMKAGALTDFMTGGLASQIEHHLFPTMPRNRLREAERIVKGFCAEHGIPYCETGALESYVEVFRHLHDVSASLQGI